MSEAWHIWRTEGKRIIAGLSAAAVMLPLAAEAAPQQMLLPVGTPGRDEAVMLPYSWDDDWLDGSSYGYNHSLARLAGALMSTVYLQPYGGLSKLYAAFGVEPASVADYHYAAEEKDLPDKSGYTFAVKDIVADGKPGRLLTVVVRGTTGQQEWLSNLNVADTTRSRQTYHEGFEKSARLILKDLQAYIAAHGLADSSTRILVTGHSRGAAVADLVGAFLDDGTIDGEKADWLAPSHVYVYTFAPANSCSDLAMRRKAVYRNIFNIVNPEDPVPELPFRGGSWGYGKFGVILHLPSADGLRGDKGRYQTLLEHMDAFFTKLTGGRHFTPLPGSERLARDVKNLQWAVGSVSHFYHRSGKLGYRGASATLASIIPVEDDDRVTEPYTGGLKIFERRHPREMAGAEDMHAPATYNAWLLSGGPQDIYLRGTPTVVALRVMEKDGNVHLLQGQIPFEAEITIPSGEELATLDAGKAEPITGQADCELQTVGSRLATFVVPEGEKLSVRLTARDKDTSLCITTKLEANLENGLSAAAPAIDDKQIVLKKGETKSFTIVNRRLVMKDEDAKAPADTAK